MKLIITNIIFILLLSSCKDKNSLHEKIKNIEKDSLVKVRVVNPKINLGKISNDSTVIFKLINYSNNNYQIIDILPTCECSQISYNSNKIKYLDTLKISVKFDPNLLFNHRGFFRKFIAVVGNSKPTSINLTIEGVYEK